jgi:hypothetical protein
MYLVQVFYGSAGFGTFLQVSALASQWLDDCANFTPTSHINREKYTFCIIKSLEHLKYFKNGLILYLGLKLTIHVQKPNPSRETVPLRRILVIYLAQKLIFFKSPARCRLWFSRERLVWPGRQDRKALRAASGGTALRESRDRPVHRVSR